MHERPSLHFHFYRNIIPFFLTPGRKVFGINFVKYENEQGARLGASTDRDIGVAVDAVVEEDLSDLLVALLGVCSVA